MTLFLFTYLLMTVALPLLAIAVLAFLLLEAGGRTAQSFFEVKNALAMFLIVCCTGCATMDLDGLKGWWNTTDHWKNDLTDAQRSCYNNNTWNTWGRMFGTSSDLSLTRRYIIAGDTAYPLHRSDEWWVRYRKLKITTGENGQTIITHPNQAKPAWATHWFMDIKK